MENKNKEKEKLEAEIARSLSVIKMKETHKQIEDIEKLRKKTVILSINQRLDLNIRLTKSLIKVLLETKKEYSAALYSTQISSEFVTQSLFETAIQTYKSIRFDLQRNIDLKNEDFERLFPKESISIDTFSNITQSLGCLLAQMQDMKAYCARLL